VTGPGTRGPRKLRLFFALWPGERRRAALAAAVEPVVERIDGQAVLPGNLHVTLAFLGSVPGRTLAALLEIGRLGSWPRVDLEFERVEFWAKPKVVVALPRSVPATGASVVEHLWGALVPLGFERELRPWQPHLTLARRVRRPPPENLSLAPVTGREEESPWRLALVESAARPGGVRYKPLADWSLTGGDSPL
jgi:RNA 2',3'-cyclic 3'-phosphodiesterase